MFGETRPHPFQQPRLTSCRDWTPPHAIVVGCRYAIRRTCSTSSCQTVNWSVRGSTLCSSRLAAKTDTTRHKLLFNSAQSSHQKLEPAVTLATPPCCPGPPLIWVKLNQRPQVLFLCLSLDLNLIQRPQVVAERSTTTISERLGPPASFFALPQSSRSLFFSSARDVSSHWRGHTEREALRFRPAQRD